MSNAPGPGVEKLIEAWMVLQDTSAVSPSSHPDGDNFTSKICTNRSSMCVSSLSPSVRSEIISLMSSRIALTIEEFVKTPQPPSGRARPATIALASQVSSQVSSKLSLQLNIQSALSCCAPLAPGVLKSLLTSLPNLSPRDLSRNNNNNNNNAHYFVATCLTLTSVIDPWSDASRMQSILDHIDTLEADVNAFQSPTTDRSKEEAQMLSLRVMSLLAATRVYRR